MNPKISFIHTFPVKSMSYNSISSCIIKKNHGMINDRIFAFTRNLDFVTAKHFEREPKIRKLNNFLTLKNSPVLNKYIFKYDGSTLSLLNEDNQLLSSINNNFYEDNEITKKLLKVEPSLGKSIYMLKNIIFPFFDTTFSGAISNSISLINLNSVKSLQKIVGSKIEYERFRGNIYLSDLNAWEERNWIKKIIKINSVSFKVDSHISRCSAINLKPKTDNITINLPINLKKYYDHTDMGIYLTPINSGKINIGNEVLLNE